MRRYVCEAIFRSCPADAEMTWSYMEYMASGLLASASAGRPTDNTSEVWRAVVLQYQTIAGGTDADVGARYELVFRLRVAGFFRRARGPNDRLQRTAPRIHASTMIGIESKSQRSSHAKFGRRDNVNLLTALNDDE